MLDNKTIPMPKETSNEYLGSLTFYFLIQGYFLRSKFDLKFFQVYRCSKIIKNQAQSI